MVDLFQRISRTAEAIQFTGGELQAAEIDAWLDLWGEVLYNCERFVDSKEPQYINGEMFIPVLQYPEHLTIITDSGNFHVPLEYWIVKQSDGVQSVMSDEVFRNTYERIENNE